jgi:hypothetical protein
MKEIRAIVFTDEEVQLALAEHQIRRGKPLPGRIATAAMANNPVSVTVELIDQSGRRTSLTFSETELAASMIAFCIARKVPLPAKAEKQVELLSNGVALMISIPDSASIVPAVRSSVVRRSQD